MPFHDNYSELWSAYSSLRSALQFWKRQALDKAWQEFMVMEFYEEIPEDQLDKVFVKGIHVSREQAVNNCGKFIQFINKLR